MALHVFVIKETELEDPQDLRAEIGKCPVSTNERKNMSTKTLRKRIALVAVSALGAGLLSVVAVPSANATSDITSIRTGSIGLLGGTADASITSITSTATLLSTGTLAVSADDGYFTVSSGAVVSGFLGTVHATDVIDSDQAGVLLPAATGTATGFTVKPTGAAGSTFTVTSYNEAGTVVAERITVTIAGASVAGTVSAADSTLSWVADAAESATDVSGKSKAVYNNPLYLNIQLADAYGNPIDSVKGALVATVTAGAVVTIGAANHASITSKGTFTQAVSNADPTSVNLRIDEKTVGTGWSGSVTVTYNGVTIGSKTGTITGAPAAIAITPKKIGTVGNNVSAFAYVVKDLAGNELATTGSTIVLTKSSDTSVVSGAVGVVDSNPATSPATVGYGDVTCVKAGSAKVTVQITTNGTTVKSNEFTATCGGDAYSYTASFDKAVYAQGDIATLTVTFKDAAGNLANSYTRVSDATTADQTISSPMMDRVGGTTYTVAEKPGAAGTVTHTFTVGGANFSAGKYNAIVSYPTLANGTKQTVSYEVTNSGSAVSNADVLKAIVSLIASINKQIAALQKALLRR
jgi:trimeric autotransporter adhesin